MLGNDFTQGQKNEFNLPDLGFGGPQFPQSNFGFDNNSWNFSARMDMGGPMNSAVNTNFGYSASNLNATGAVAGPLASSIPQASASSVPAVTFPSASGTVSPPPIQSATSAGAGAGGGMHGSAGAMGGGMGMGMGMGMGGMSGMTGMGGMGGGGDWGSMGNMNTMGSMGNMGSMGSMGSINAPQASATSAASWDGSSLENEPPLLEELGIDFKEIIAKTKAVVFPVLSSGGLKPKGPQSSEADGADADLAGPLVFGLLLGVVLLFTGKVHFGYIYGFGISGCVLLWVLLNLMCEGSISFDRTMHIFGYCLPPIVILAAVSVFFNLKTPMGHAFALMMIVWCTFIATRYVEVALDMRNQRYLIGYPIALLYACFALLSVF